MRDARSSLHFLSCLRSRLLLLLLSVCDDVADVLVVNIASHIWGEGGPQILHLKEKEVGFNKQSMLSYTNLEK